MRMRASVRRQGRVRTWRKLRDDIGGVARILPIARAVHRTRSLRRTGRRDVVRPRDDRADRARVADARRLGARVRRDAVGRAARGEAAVRRARDARLRGTPRRRPAVQRAITRSPGGSAFAGTSRPCSLRSRATSRCQRERGADLPTTSNPANTSTIGWPSIGARTSSVGFWSMRRSMPCSHAS